MVGIGSGINAEELDHMAGGAGKAYTAKSFDELTGASFTSKLTEASCKVGKGNIIMFFLSGRFGNIRFGDPSSPTQSYL